MLYGACCGHLIESLGAGGYRPEQIDEILLTHLHADHVGGIAPGGQMAFPNAVIRASSDRRSAPPNPASSSALRQRQDARQIAMQVDGRACSAP